LNLSIFSPFCSLFYAPTEPLWRLRVILVSLPASFLLFVVVRFQESTEVFFHAVDALSFCHPLPLLSFSIWDPGVPLRTDRYTTLPHYGSLSVWPSFRWATSLLSLRGSGRSCVFSGTKFALLSCQPPPFRLLSMARRCGRGPTLGLSQPFPVRPQNKLHSSLSYIRRESLSVPFQHFLGICWRVDAMISFYGQLLLKSCVEQRLYGSSSA